MPQERDAEATRQRILTAARQEFVAKGLAGARVDEIARQSGANKRMLYHYFGSKEDLYTEVIRRADTDLAQHFPLVEEMAPAEAVQSAAGALIDYCVANPDYVALVLWEAVSGWNTFDRLASRATDAATIRLVKTVERGIALGVFRAEIDPLLAVNAAIAQIIMYSSINPRLRPGDPAKFNLSAVRQGLIDLFLHSLLRKA